MFSCDKSLQLCLFTVIVWMFVMATFRLKKLSTRLATVGVFSLLLTFMAMMTSQSCIQSSYLMRKTTIDNQMKNDYIFHKRELLRNGLSADNLTKLITKEEKTDRELFGKIPEELKISSIKNSPKTHPVEGEEKQNMKIEANNEGPGVENAKTVVEEVLESKQPGSYQDTKLQAKIDKVITRDEDIYNGPNVRFPLYKYKLLATHANAYNTAQAKRLLMENPPAAAEAWKRGVSRNEIPLSSREAIERFHQYLPWWEIEEIKLFPRIWYLGLGAKKSIMTSNITLNFGFSEDNKNSKSTKHYKAALGDHVAFRYKILKVLGRGTFGRVVEAFDYNTNTRVAIKFFVTNTKKWTPETYTNELNMMKFINSETTSKTYFPLVYETFTFRNHLCVVEELLGIDFSSYMDDPVRNFTTLKRYARDIIRPIADLHRMGVVHMDLKSDGKSDGQLLKVVDFGHSCIKGSSDFKCRDTDSVQTIGYECPEVHLDLEYDKPCDMFGVGIILVKMITGRQMFDGENSVDSFAVMMEILGLPPAYMIEQSPRKSFFSDAICYVKKNGFKRRIYRKPLSTLIKGDTPDDLYDLVERCLQYEPSNRITASQALRHPFLI